MSVYTPVSQSELESFLSQYSIGGLVSFSGIETGITNSNFWLETETGHYVLTLYEHHQPATLDYLLNLQLHLAERGVACATPVIDNHQNFYSILNNRPAAINRRIEGEVCTQLTPWHCSLIGNELAKFHLAGKEFSRQQSNPCGNQWRLLMQQKLLPVMPSADKKILGEELRAYRVFENTPLATGPTHSDLFHDNCLFTEKAFGGIIDFDYACNESLLYDLAITLNDCCIDENGELKSSSMRALINAYEKLRPLQPIELDYLNLMLRLAASRFWLSRLHDYHFPLEGELTFQKDPDEFKNILLLRRALT